MISYETNFHGDSSNCRAGIMKKILRKMKVREEKERRRKSELKKRKKESNLGRKEKWNERQETKNGRE